MKPIIRLSVQVIQVIIMTAIVEEPHAKPEYALSRDLLYIVAEYMIVTEDTFYKLFPDVYERRLDRDYNHKTSRIDGLHHSLHDRPIIRFHTETQLTIVWYHHGKYHRDSRPAIINFSGPLHLAGNSGYRFSVHLHFHYYQFGEAHRLDGPASTSFHTREYIIYGMHVYPPVDATYFPDTLQPGDLPISLAKNIVNRYPGLIDANLCDPVKSAVNYPKRIDKTDYKAWAEAAISDIDKGQDLEKCAKIAKAVRLYKKYNPFNKPATSIESVIVG